MKPSAFFLSGLVIVAVCNLALTARREYQLRSLPPALVQTHPAEAFAARLDAVSDPAELRRLALGRHQALLNADHATQSLLVSLEGINRSALIESGAVLLLALGASLLDKHPPRG